MPALLRKSSAIRSNITFTLNETANFVDNGYGTGALAPGLKLPPARLNQLRHIAMLVHGLAVQAIRAKAPGDTKVGIAENITSASR